MPATNVPGQVIDLIDRNRDGCRAPAGGVSADPGSYGGGGGDWQIDRLAYELCDLTDDEIRIIKEAADA